MRLALASMEHNKVTARDLKQYLLETSTTHDSYYADRRVVAIELPTRAQWGMFGTELGRVGFCRHS